MSLAEGIKLMLEQGFEKGFSDQNGILKVIATTDLELFEEKMKEEEEKEGNVTLHNAKCEEIERVLQDENTKALYLYRYEGEPFRVREMVREYDKNIAVILPLPKDMNHRLVRMADLRHTDYEQEAGVITGITEAGVIRLKHRYGKVGEITFEEIHQLD